jgi:hypothetical protein
LPGSGTASSPGTVQPIYIINPTNPNTGVQMQLQFNGLVVESVAPTPNGWQILASNPMALSQMLSGSTTNTPSLSTTQWGSCSSFSSASDTIGTSTPCPPQPAVTYNNTSTGVATLGWLYAPYTISVSTSTRLLLSDRIPATIANIMPGDEINVYGLYDPKGSMGADIIRDLSQPTGPTYQAPAVSTSTLETLITTLEGLLTNLAQNINMPTPTQPVSSNTSSSASAPMIPYVPGGGIPATSYPLTTSTTNIQNVPQSQMQILPSPGSTSSGSSTSSTSVSNTSNSGVVNY